MENATSNPTSAAASINAIANQSIQQIDTGLKACRQSGTAWNDNSLALQAIMLSSSIIQRLTPGNSPYRDAAQKIVQQTNSFTSDRQDRSVAVEKLIGILSALRCEYELGYASTVTEMVRIQTLNEILDQAQHHLKTGGKDAAAVLIGGVLERHIKALCAKHTVATTRKKADGKSCDLTLQELVQDLSKAGIYNAAQEKILTSLLGVRNLAAHGNYDQYDKKQVTWMLDAVTEFMANHSA